MTKEIIRELWESGKGQREMARETGVPRSTIQVWIKEFKGHVTEAPLSETAIPKLHECTPEEALADVRALAEANPEMAMSRNWYRIHGKYSESAWSRYFGTFHELKRQAGIVLTRQQHNLEKQIAKHASVDHYRAMNHEVRSYGNKYDKPNSKRFKQALIFSDLHDINCDPFYLEVLIDTVKRVQPDLLVLAGDGVDLCEFGRYPVDARTWDVVGRIKFLHNNILKPLREACPHAQFDFICGNHEFRILKHLADATPALRAVLSDLHGMTVGSLLGLDEFDINFVCKGDLSAYTLADQHKEVSKNYRKYWDSFIVSHEIDGKKLGYPGVSGHHHKTHVHPMYSEHFGTHYWVEMSGGHKLDAEYTHPKWSLGFVIATCDTLTKQTVFDTITFSENFAVVGGVFYERQES